MAGEKSPISSVTTSPGLSVGKKKVDITKMYDLDLNGRTELNMAVTRGDFVEIWAWFKVGVDIHRSFGEVGKSILERANVEERGILIKYDILKNGKNSNNTPGFLVDAARAGVLDLIGCSIL